MGCFPATHKFNFGYLLFTFVVRALHFVQQRLGNFFDRFFSEKI